MSTEARWNAIKFWRDTYLSGTRITYSNGSFRFQKCLWPSRLRVETIGEFGKFPVEDTRPDRELLELVEVHRLELLPLLSQKPPAAREERKNCMG